MIRFFESNNRYMSENNITSVKHFILTYMWLQVNLRSIKKYPSLLKLY